jgi:uncharacterized protein (DUF952 family)
MQTDPRLTPRRGWAMPIPMAIYKILRTDEWQSLLHHGETAGAPIDVTDGYVHFSTAAQCLETANKHFADATGLWVLAVDDTRLAPDLKWEPSRGGQLFPHLYRPLRLSDLLWARPMGAGVTGHTLPDGVA